MEITYDTGAKVILQGPVTYRVESKDGGYLSLGKLTARLEKKGERSPNLQISKSDISNPQSPIPNPSLSTIHYPLFTIRTPTATVTDLGTEFGVEVDPSGVTESHVFAGKVRVLALSANNRAGGQEVSLGENESVRVEKSADAAESAVVIRRGVAKPEGFVRTGQFAKRVEQSKLTPFKRWQAYSRQLRLDSALVAYYTFERHSLSTSTLPNQSAAGSVLDGQVEGAEWVLGRLPGKLALYFHGPNSGDKVVLPEQERFNFTGPFSVAVWFNIYEFNTSHQSLVAKGRDSWRVQRCDIENTLRCASDSSSGCINRTDGKTNVADRRWHLAVAVYEPVGNTVRQGLYIDGHLDAEGAAPLPLKHNDTQVLLGATRD